jgi:hypothetical protein
MKFSTAIFLASIVAGGSALAQGEPGRSRHMLGPFGSFSVPVGEFSDAAGTGYGGGIRYQLGVDKQAAFVSSVSYHAWGEKDFDSSSTAQTSAIQFLLGAKYYAIRGLFVSAELGLNSFTITLSDNAVPPVDFDKTRGRIATPVGVGYQLEGFEAIARYFLFDTDYRNFTFTVGYNVFL